MVIKLDVCKIFPWSTTYADTSPVCAKLTFFFKVHISARSATFETTDLQTDPIISICCRTAVHRSRKPVFLGN